MLPYGHLGHEDDQDEDEQDEDDKDEDDQDEDDRDDGDDDDEPFTTAQCNPQQPRAAQGSPEQRKIFSTRSSNTTLKTTRLKGEAKRALKSCFNEFLSNVKSI